MSRSLLPSNATSKIRPQNWRVYTYYNWWHFKRHCTWTSCDPIQALVRDKCLHAQDTHTHTHTLLRHLGGVDNHKDLLNGGGRSSLYQVLLYRPSDKWDCHDGRVWGAEGPTVLWIKLKPPNEPGRRTRPGCHLVWWTPWSCRGGDEWANAFLFTELKRRGRWK